MDTTIQNYFIQHKDRILKAREDKTLRRADEVAQLGIAINTETLRNRFNRFVNASIATYHPTKEKVLEEKITSKEEDGIHEVKYEGGEVRTIKQFLENIEFDSSKHFITKSQSNLRPVVIRVSAKETKLVNKYEHFLQYRYIINVDIDNILDKVSDKLKNHQKIIPITRTEGSKAMQINIFDAHINKKSFNDTEWNCDIAQKSYIGMIKAMINDAPSDLEKILLVIGQDFLNTDHKQKTSNDTPQDNVESEEESREAGLNIIIEAVELLGTLGKPIDIISMPGNHARTLEQVMGTALNAIYGKNKDITIDYKPAHRKYWTFGNSAICICHGDGMKINDMPMLFANERPDLWGTYKYKEVHHGHIHTQMVSEIKGLIVRSFASSTTTDRRHSLNGYVGNIRGGHMIIWDKEQGNKAQFNYYI